MTIFSFIKSVFTNGLKQWQKKIVKILWQNKILSMARMVTQVHNVAKNSYSQYKSHMKSECKVEGVAAQYLKEM